MQTFQLTGDAVTGIVTSQAMKMQAQSLPTTVQMGRVGLDRGEFQSRLNRHGLTQLTTATPPPPTCDWSPAAMEAINRMYGNDKEGCCVISGKFHNVGVWSGNDKTCLVGTDQEAHDAYMKLGYRPGTDSGCVITRVLDEMKGPGIMMGGGLRKIDNYVPVDWTNKTLWQSQQVLYGASTIGFLVPQDWLSKSVWDVSNAPIVGGHDVSPVGYNAQGIIVSSWGRLYIMTWAAFLTTRYMDEAYAMTAFYWWNTDQMAPNKFDTQTLKDNLIKVGQGIVPDLTPPTPTPPPNTGWTIQTSGPVKITGTGTKPIILP